MAKKSQRRPVRYEKDQFGCMSGLISIFDFRHRRYTQKLLSDRRRAGRYAAGAGDVTTKLGMLTYTDDNEGTFDGEEGRIVAVDAGKPSVKKLIEEEMINEQDAKKEINNAEIQSKPSDPEQGSHRKKTRKRMNRTQSKSCDSINDLDAPENFKAGQPHRQISKHQSANSLDIDTVMGEFYHQIHQKSASYMKDEQLGELDLQPNQNNPDFEDKLREAIKLLISQKLVQDKHLPEGGEIHPSKEVMDVLEILGPEGEVFAKRLQDPNSLLVKCIQNFPDTQVEQFEDCVSLAGSNMSEQDVCNLRQSNEFVNHKQRYFFRRKVKSQERSSSNGEKTAQSSNRIVILKPGPTGSQNPETESTVGSSPESHNIVRNKEPNERIGSHFSLTEIKRKLKYAMGKEHLRISTNGIQTGDRDRGFKANVGINSPTKDHFFIEKISRPGGVEKVDKNGKLKDCEFVKEQKSADLPKQSVSNIYIEARKHLSEMLSTGDEDINFSSGPVLKTLGRILSLPEYNFSPVGSPGRLLEDGFITAQMRYSDSDKFQKMHENTSSFNEDSHISHQGQIAKSFETQLCISDDSSDSQLQSTFNPAIMIEKIHDNEVKQTSPPVGDEKSSAVDVEIVERNEIEIRENNALETPSQASSSSSIKDDDQNGNESKICNEETPAKHMKQDVDSTGDNQLPSSPVPSASSSLITKNVEDRETAVDIVERPSPVSVLEPLFAEDDISPASIRSHAVDVAVQPHRIQFEEYASSDAVQSFQMKSSMDEKESMFEYVKAVLLTSGLNLDELCMKSLTTDQLLDPSLFDAVEFIPNQLCCEQKLIFDLINEVLLELCGHYFSPSSVSFVKPYIRPVPNKEDALRFVWEGVLWYLIPLPLPHTLEQTVRKDMAKSGSWMDLRFDTDGIGIEMGDAILEELMEDTIFSGINECTENGSPVLQAELKESESSNNSETGYYVLETESKAIESSILS